VFLDHDAGGAFSDAALRAAVNYKTRSGPASARLTERCVFPRSDHLG
jgi:hypothetical protein